jgi:hypothetical protein
VTSATAAAPQGAQTTASALATPKKAASQPTRQAKAAAVASAADVLAPAAVRPEPEAAPRPQTPPVTANAGIYQAVEQCKDKMFLTREICLSENCAKPGARNHAMCVRYRDEVRLREESRQPRGP